MEGLSIAVKVLYVFFIDRQYFIGTIGQQDTCLLKKFTDGGSSGSTAKPGTTFGVCQGWCNRHTYTFGQLCRTIITRDGATRENVDIGHEVALNDSSYREDFYTLP